jgi:hypothetical protein
VTTPIGPKAIINFARRRSAQEPEKIDVEAQAESQVTLKLYLYPETTVGDEQPATDPNGDDIWNGTLTDPDEDGSEYRIVEAADGGTSMTYVDPWGTYREWPGGSRCSPVKIHPYHREQNQIRVSGMFRRGKTGTGNVTVTLKLYTVDHALSDENTFINMQLREGPVDVPGTRLGNSQTYKWKYNFNDPAPGKKCALWAECEGYYNLILIK